MTLLGIELRVQAERIIRADRIARGRSVSHLNFESLYRQAMRDYLGALQRINRMADILFP
jgi:hypothetical protein